NRGMILCHAARAEGGCGYADRPERRRAADARAVAPLRHTREFFRELRSRSFGARNPQDMAAFFHFENAADESLTSLRPQNLALRHSAALEADRRRKSRAAAGDRGCRARARHPRLR